MATPNSKYWKQRFAQLEAAQNRRAQETFIDVGLAYRQAEKQLEADVDRWYRRFADNNSITLPEARKLLTKGELREFKWDVREYMKYAEENMITGQWEKELENASARFHISRLEALKINTAAAIEKLYNKEEQKLNFHLSEEYQTDYYRTIYEIQKGYNTYFDVAKLDLNRIDKLLKKPWAPDGYNFSERIWNDKNKLINNVHRDLMQCIMTGEPLNKAIDRLTKRMNTARYNAERLIRTESAWSASLATEDGFKELDVEKYEIIAALDDRTCAGECQGLDGQVYETKDYQAGLTAPPFHPNCRCTTAPHFDKWYGLKRQRAAKDGDGKTYYVDADMKYPEWKAKYVDKIDKNSHNSVDKSSRMGYNKGRGEGRLEQAKKRDHKIFITDTAVDKITPSNSKCYSNKENAMIDEFHRELLTIAKNENDSNEVAILFDLQTGEDAKAFGTEKSVQVFDNPYATSLIDKPNKLFLAHNHPSTNNLSYSDIGIFLYYENINGMSAVSNTGVVHMIVKSEAYDFEHTYETIKSIRSKYGEKLTAEEDALIVKEFLKNAKDLGIEYNKGGRAT